MKRKWPGSGSCGFSLIELMAVIAIFGIVSMAAYAMYSVQQRSYLMQEQLVDMQQNVRAFLYYIEKDLRMAGYNPLQVVNLGGFSKAHSTEAVFSADIGRIRTSSGACTGAGCDSMPDGLINCTGTDCSNILYSVDPGTCTDCVKETVRYALASSPTLKANGQVDTTTNPTAVTTVRKTFNGATETNSQSVVEYVQALEFLYYLKDGSAVTDVPTANLGDIRSVTVSLLVRTRNQIKGFHNTAGTQYCPASNPEKGRDAKGIAICTNSAGKIWGPFSDNYRRRLVITNIQCRNMSTRVED